MNETQVKIFKTAKRLFETQGYYDTTVREITDAAGVNSGLFSYYFKNKSTLAVKIYDNMFHNIKLLSKKHFGHIQNPAIYAGTMMRMHLYTINDNLTIKFTIDALKEGLYEAAIIENSLKIVSIIDRYYHSQLSSDQQRILITMTLGQERSMITQNKLGLYHVDSKTLADFSLRSHLFLFGLETKEIDYCLTQVQENFQLLLNEKPDFVNDIVNP